ncbi:MAG: hypothetical protein Q9166_006301 [cf. Caloplaca sp. 2 TL-2023]
MADLRLNAGPFLIFYLFQFICLLTMSMFFRMVGLVSKTHAQAMAPVALSILNLILSIGFIPPVPEMKAWVRWIGYINPMAYTFESLMINEFRDLQFPCTSMVPAGPEYISLNQTGYTCATAGATPGRSYVNGNLHLVSTYGFVSSHLWRQVFFSPEIGSSDNVRNLGILLCFMAFFTVVHIVAAELFSTPTPSRDVLLFQRTRNSDICSLSDIEKAPPDEASTSGRSVPGIEIPASIEKHKHGPVLTWSGLQHNITLGGKSVTILNGVDGLVKPGTLTVLMGATGAGKTTLLDVLANRAAFGTTTGDILVGGCPRTESFQRSIGYVQQADIHIPTSTVREALMFGATLRQPKATTIGERRRHIDDILISLGMESYADAVIGLPGHDEPTSGLDSQTAWSICKLLRKLADRGQAILCTIHQPSASLFQVFDQLLLLGHGGRSLYFGDIGTNATIVKNYFEKHGAPQCRAGINPAEWLLDVSKTVAESRPSTDLAAEWQKSREKVYIEKTIVQVNDIQSSSNRNPHLENDGEFATSFTTQLLAVTYRKFQEDWRTPSYLFAKTTVSTGTAFFIGISFWKAPTSIQGLQDQIFSIFLLMTAFSNLTQLIIERFVQARALFEARERLSKSFSRSVFLLSSILAEIPSQTVIAVLMFVCWYYPVGMSRNMASEVNERGAMMFLFIWAFCIFTSTFSHMIVAGVEQAGTAVNLIQLLYLLSLIFCGVLIQPNDLPKFWSFMNRVSPLTYLIGGMALVGLADVPVTCSSLEVTNISAPLGQTCGDFMGPYVQRMGGKILNPKERSACQYCPASKTDEVLGAMGFEYSQRWRDFGLMMVYVAFNVFGAYLFYWMLKSRSFKKH